MGQAKKMLMEQEEQELTQNEFTEFFERLLVREYITNLNISGIAKHLTTKGYDSLSKDQLRVLQDFTAQFREKYECSQCYGTHMSGLLDYLEVLETGYCTICEIDRENYLRD
ncbi:hypothetical protein AAEO56_07705 [Flavobacterium sp. DGU11]|uniref:Uncharacterized protein n=1 Tax=Flavobacterium arundinis TaxID=3139143 RepID=A0ABU9HVE9_9FLAO